MREMRRDFLRLAGVGMTTGATMLLTGSAVGRSPDKTERTGEMSPLFFNVRTYGAAGDGKTIDSPAINAAIVDAAAVGGGTVVFPAGIYLSYSIRLQSFVSLYLEQGATILAAPTPYEGMSVGGYDAAEPQGDWEPYPGLWPQSLAQQLDLGRKHSQHRHLWTRFGLGQRSQPGQMRGTPETETRAWK